MKKEETPQDDGALGRIAREVNYVVDQDGKYSTAQSTGWDVKTEALNIALEDVRIKVEEAARKVTSGEASPVLYYMEKSIMNPAILSAYTGFWKWSIRRHMIPSVFEKLSDRKLQKYATVFGITIDKLKNPF